MPNLDPQNFNGQQIISAGFGAIEYQFTPKLFVIAGFVLNILSKIFLQHFIKTG